MYHIWLRIKTNLQSFLAEWLRKDGWIVLYVSPFERSCTSTQTCWIQRYTIMDEEKFLAKKMD